MMRSARQRRSPGVPRQLRGPILIGLLLLIVPTIAACGGGTEETYTSRAEVESFVDEAVAYARAHSREEVLATFTEPGGPFHRDDLYIFAYDFDGTVLAHGGDPSLVGRDLIDLEDPNGVPVIRELVDLARNGSGWLFYAWPNPQADDAVKPKLGYVVAVDDDWFLGSGTYGPDAQP